MTKLLVSIDGSSYADHICTLAAWAAKRLDADIDLLHVLRRHSDYEAEHDDHTGSIGFGARSNLLEALTEVDEERGRLDQKKGKLILEHGAEILKEAGMSEEKINTLHRRGALVETIQEFEDNAEIIFVGKRGEHADEQSAFLGSNLEKVARSIHHPLCVVSSRSKPVETILIAYDGKDNVRKAVDYVCNSPLFKGVKCHLLAVEQSKGDIDITETQNKLTKAGFDVTTSLQQDGHPDKVITEYVQDHAIDMLVTGAYSHSRMHSFFLGSTTASLIKSCKVPLLLFR